MLIYLGAWLILYVHSNFAIILMGKRELVALLNLSSWCLVIDMWLFLAVPWVCLQFVIVTKYFLIIIMHSLFFLLSDFRVKLERTSNSSQSTRPVGRLLWEKLLALSISLIIMSGRVEFLSPDVLALLKIHSVCSHDKI